MGRRMVCPFCGEFRKSTREHVWAQWLDETEGAQQLLNGTSGERIKGKQAVLRKDGNGRYEAVVETRALAKWLPNVTVSVCGDCNSGWMSHLEDQARLILRDVIFEGGTRQLAESDLRVLAVWATKSWMAYALTFTEQHNPFTQAEYREMAASPSPLPRSRVWLTYSEEPIAHVALAIFPWLLSGSTSPVPDMATTPDNTGYAYLAVSKVVLIMVLVPEEMPEQSLDALASVVPSSDLIKRAWPDPQPHDFPLAALPDGTLANLVKVMRETESEIGLPTLGLTDAQRTGIRTLFDNGTDPAVLQAVFGKDEDMGPTASRIARYLKSMEGQGDNSEGLG